jgi:ubiquinone/menaquinone biosynthesis C-methylase UbiE
MNDVLHLLERSEFPRSNRYDPAWVLDNQMGPNALWLTEWLTDALPLEPGMRVLDLGCGRAMTSIFLAKEFGVQVWAADLWISPEHNWRRAMVAGVADSVFPIRAEAHDLPFAEGFFDAIISIDAYQYFGTDLLYLPYASRFVKPGGFVGMVVPGLTQPFSTVPDHLLAPQASGKTFWSDDCWTFNTADWWRDLWRKTAAVSDVVVDTMPDGWRQWAEFETALAATGKGIFPSDAEALNADQGRFIGFIRAVARRTDAPMENFYDPTIGSRAGVDN